MYIAKINSCDIGGRHGSDVTSAVFTGHLYVDNCVFLEHTYKSV